MASPSKSTPPPPPTARIEACILSVRGQKVMIDADLAQLYGVPTKVLNQAIKRNLQRFPADFMFQLTPEEKTEVVTNCDHLTRLKFSRGCPYAFTEHGAIQAANVLNSTEAVEIGVYVVRAFVHLRSTLSVNAEVIARLNDLESKTALLALKHDTFENATQTQLKQILGALRELMAPPEQVAKRPIGFVTPEDTKPQGTVNHRTG